MKKYILIILGAISLCLICIEMFYESPISSGRDLYMEDNLGMNMPIFDQSLDSTAVLSLNVQHILGLYVPYILSEVEDTCFAIDLHVSQQSNRLVNLSIQYAAETDYSEGTYCGASRYKGHIVRLWGENINEFWRTASRQIEVTSDTTYYYCSSDDQCSWWLCIDMFDRKIRPHECSFFCGFPYPEDTLINMW